MNSNDPWGRLRTPESDTNLQLIRVDSEHPWDLFWGRSVETILLVARLKEPCVVDGKLPALKGLRVSSIGNRSGTIDTLMVELLDNSGRDFFHAFCQDIVNATRQATSGQQLINEMVSRTWKWHRFLQKGRSGRLTQEEQRGLVGELTVLVQYLIPHLGPGPSVEGWTGPVGAARDFEYGSTCIEVKARRAAALPFVEISSEFQLDSVLLENLYLTVVDVTASSENKGKPLREIVDTARSLLSMDGDALDLFDERLLALGYVSTDDYSNLLWVIGEIAFFRVDGGFPVIRYSNLPDGLSRVEYRLSLQHIQAYAVSWSAVGVTVKGLVDADHD